MKNLTETPVWAWDSDFQDFIFAEYKEWKAGLRATLPATDAGWLEVFPEAKAVIPAKIKEWEAVAKIAQTKVRTALKIIEEKSKPENHWFWRTVLMYGFKPVEELAIAKRHVKRLGWLIRSGNKSRAMVWSNAVENARRQDLVRIAESFGVHLRQAGRTYQSLCPFHNERTASFHIYPPTHFVCYGCGAKGDVISFVQLITKCTFKEAVYKLNN